MVTDLMDRTKYQAQIRRDNPTCMLFLIDQSGSMNESAMASNRAKKHAVVSVLNRFLYNVSIRCAQGENNEVFPYFSVGVIGYSNQSARSAFVGPLEGRQLVTISELANHATLQAVREGNKTVTQRVWFQAAADGGTPMCAGLRMARETVGGFLNEHPDCFPPIVVHITDGESTDGDPSQEAEQLKLLESRDGRVLLFNVHISSIGATGIIFPSNEKALPDAFARLLFNMSSELPVKILEDAARQGHSVTPGARAFAFNTDMSQLTNILDVGSRSAMQQMAR